MEEIMAMEFIRRLPTPEEIKKEYPIDDNIRKIKAAATTTTVGQNRAIHAENV